MVVSMRVVFSGHRDKGVHRVLWVCEVYQIQASLDRYALFDIHIWYFDHNKRSSM